MAFKFLRIDTSTGSNTQHAAADDFGTIGALTITTGVLTTGTISTLGGAMDCAGQLMSNANITIGSNNTLDVSAGALTTTAVQKLAILEGAAADVDIGSYSLTAQTLVSDVSTGTAPLTVASSTVVANLNASFLGGATFAAPGAIGGTTKGTGAFSSLELGTGSTVTGILNSDTMAGTSATTLATSASIKAYVDSVASGLDIKESVVMATTSASDFTSGYTYNSTAGTITKDAASAVLIDGIATGTTGQRVLVKDQTDPIQNGIYTVTTASSGTVALVLTRAYRADGTTLEPYSPGSFVFVESGTDNADTGFVISTDGTITVGTHGMAWTKFSTQGVITAGLGVLKTGNAMSLNLTTLADTITAADQDDILAIIDTSASSATKKITFSSFEDSIFANISGDALVAAGGALTIQADAVQLTMLNDDILDDSSLEFGTSGVAHYAITLSAATTADGGISSIYIGDAGDTYYEDSQVPSGDGTYTVVGYSNGSFGTAVSDSTSTTYFKLLFLGTLGGGYPSAAELTDAQSYVYSGSAASETFSTATAVTLPAGTMQVAAGGVTNEMLAGSIADSKLSTITTGSKVSGSAVQLAGTSAIENTSGLALKSALAGTGLSLSSQVLSVDAAQTQITSLGTLTALQVDNININLNTISATSGAITLTAAADSAVAVEGVSFDGGIVTGASSITSTAFAGALTGNASTATALAAGVTIGMTGDVVWTSASFDGSGNVTGSSVIQASAVELAMLDPGLIQLSSESFADNDTSLMTSAAINDRIEALVAGEDTIAEMGDVALSGLSAAHFLIYDGTDSWDNKAISGDVVIAATGVATIQANSVALGTDTTGNYVASLSAGTGVSVGAAAEGGTPSIAIGQAVATSDSPTFVGVTATGQVKAVGMGFSGIAAAGASATDVVYIRENSSAADLIKANAGSSTAAGALRICGVYDGAKLVTSGPVTVKAASTVEIGDPVYLSETDGTVTDAKIDSTQSSSAGKVHIRVGFALTDYSGGTISMLVSIGEPTTI